jgi:hypothetical protein
VTFGHRVLSGTSLTTLYRGRHSEFGRLSRFQGKFQSRRGGFRSVWFVYFVVAGGFGGSGPKIGFYRRSPKASRSTRKLYATRFAFYGQ